MGRYIRWQALIALSGIILAGVFLSSIALSRTTALVPDEGGIYVEGLAGVPQYINPLLGEYNQVDRDLVDLIFNGLTHPDGDGEMEPDLATSWTVSPDGLTYLFRLRRDVRWSDTMFGYRVGDPKEDLSFDSRNNADCAPLAAVVAPAFRWGRDCRPKIPWDKTVIYELHVEGWLSICSNLKVNLSNRLLASSNLFIALLICLPTN